MPLVVDDIVRHILLRADKRLVDEGDTRDPVTVRYLAVALYIVLPAGEVPHKITPVHKVQLVGEEETQVLGEGRLHDRLHLPAHIILHRLAFYARPFLVSLHVIGAAAIHTGEKHVQLVHVLVFHVVAGDVVAVFLVRVLLDDPAPRGRALFRHHDARTALILAFHLRHVGLAVEQRCLSVLLAGQVGTQREDIARRVLVHRRIRRGAHQGQRIRGIADHDNQQADQYRIQQLDIDLLALEQVNRQRRRQDDGYRISATDERDTQQHHREDEGDPHTDGMHLVAHRLPNRPNQHSAQQDDKGVDTRVVRHPEDVDKQQLEITAYLYQALHDTIHHQTDDGERHQQGDERPLHCRVREFLIVIHQRNGRDTQQVQQVDADTQAHQVGDQHDPTVGVRTVGGLLPLQDEPEHRGGEQRRIGVHLALHGAEPERIAERIRQSAHQAATHDGDQLSRRDLRAVFHHDLAGQVRDAPEQEQDRQAAEEGGHRVDHQRYLRGVGGELREQVGGQHKERRSRRMPYFQLVCRGDELTAIPEAGGGLHCHQVNG